MEGKVTREVGILEPYQRPLGQVHAGADAPAKAFTCALAAALSIDPIVVTLVRPDEDFRAPSVYLGIMAMVLALPLLHSIPRLGTRLAPILCFAGSMLAGWVTLLALVLSREARWNPEHMTDRPFKLLVMALLFALVASDPRWRPRLIASYMAGWATFVAYGLFALATGQAEARQYTDAVRTTVAALGPRENEQAVLVATGMVIVLAAMLRSSSWKAALYGGVLLASGPVFVSSGSRSGSLALAAGCVVVIVGWLLQSRGSPLDRALKLGLVLALLAGGAALLARRNTEVADAVGALGHRFQATAEGDLGYRDVLAAETVRLALQNPWHGTGLERTRDFLGGDAHNGYLKIFAEGGILAALLLAGGLFLSGAALVREVRHGESLGTAGALALMLTVSAAGQELMRGRFWLFLALLTVGPLREERR
jgi:hypothetical protein